MTPSDAITKCLQLIAEQCKEQVSLERIVFMVERLLPLGPERVMQTLSEMLEGARRFPTVAEIKSAMGLVEQSDEDKGREVGERIWGAICKFGSRNDTSVVEAYVGPIGMEVIRMQGGWKVVCDIATYDNAGTLKAQWRELGQVLARKAKSGELHTPPDFAQLPAAAQHEIKLLADKFTMKKGGAS